MFDIRNSLLFMRLNRVSRTILAISFLFCAFMWLSFLSWQRWGSVVIDGGREMNLPLRVLNGEQLYSQAYYLYGPFAPVLNAGLYGLFGPHLNVLYFAGFVCSIFILLVIFQLSRSFMPLFPATLATLAVMVLCVFKQGGHMIFPYTFAALYGTCLALGALAAQIYFIRSGRPGWMTVSGILIGLALICKLEYAFAAIASSSTLVLITPERRVEALRRFLFPALLIPAAAYAFLAWKVPVSALFRDTFFLPQSVPADLVHFNQKLIGLDNPVKTIREFLQATFLLLWIGGATGFITLFTARLITGHWFSRSTSFLRKLFFTTAIALIAFAINKSIGGIDWFISPIRALPLLAFVFGILYLRAEKARQQQPCVRALFLMSVFSFAVLIREMPRVASGGAYAAFMLPSPLLLFTYAAAVSFPRIFCRMPKAGKFARWIVLLLFISVLFSVTKHVAKVYWSEQYYSLSTARGEMRLPVDVGQVFAETLDFIAQNTKQSDPIFAAPEGSSLNFLGNRPAPLRYEVLTPGFLNDERQREAVDQLKERRVKYVFILNRATPEFGPVEFGRDYCQRLMGWIDQNYELIRVFGRSGKANPAIGEKKFFIKCYRLKTQSRTTTKTQSPRRKVSMKGDGYQ
jgi:hypothetical protein